MDQMILYKEIGKKHRWIDRLVWSDKKWTNYLESFGVNTYILKHNKDLIGYFEQILDKDKLDCEIAYFGILEEYIGKQLGGYLLSEAIKTSFNILNLFKSVKYKFNYISDTRSAWLDNGYSEPEIGEIDYYKIKNISQNELGMKVSFMHKYDAIAIGISIKPTYVHLADYSAWGISNDIGAIIQLFKKKLDLYFR